MMQAADTIYTGRVKAEKFKTEKQKLSFVTGAYVRYGWQNDSTYVIKLFNSVSKANVLSKVLNELDCKNVQYKFKTNHIPVPHTVTFSPSSELKNYFAHYKHLSE